MYMGTTSFYHYLTRTDYFDYFGFAVVVAAVVAGLSADSCSVASGIVPSPVVLETVARIA